MKIPHLLSDAEYLAIHIRTGHISGWNVASFNHPEGGTIRAYYDHHGHLSRALWDRGYDLVEMDLKRWAGEPPSVGIRPWDESTIEFLDKIASKTDLGWGR